jgi:hypothetical protein
VNLVKISKTKELKLLHNVKNPLDIDPLKHMLKDYNFFVGKMCMDA